MFIENFNILNGIDLLEESVMNLFYFPDFPFLFPAEIDKMLALIADDDVSSQLQFLFKYICMPPPPKVVQEAFYLLVAHPLILLLITMMIT